MPILIEVTAPTTGARAELAATKKAIDDVTGATKAQGAASDQAARQGSSSRQKQKQETDAIAGSLKLAGTAFAGLASEMKRQASILDSIQGPMQQHLQDLRSLDQLYKRGAISAGEYGAAQKKMTADLDAARNTRLGLKAPASSGSGSGVSDAVSGLASAAGPAGDILGSVTTGAAVQAGAVIGLVAAVASLHDAYADLHNQALRIAGTNGDVNGTITRQLELAGQLHSSLATTIGLTAKMKGGTEDLAFTEKQVAEMTKTIGEAVELSGHPLEDAAGLVDRLSYAFESGTIQGRELKGMMREFPALGDLLSKSFQKSRKDLVEMANDGKLSTQLFFNALSKGGGELDKNFGARVETIAEKVHHLKDEVTVFVGQGGNLNGSDITGIASDTSTSVGDLVGNAGKSAAKLFGIGGAAVGGGGGSSEATAPAKDVSDYNEKVDQAVGAETRFYDQLAKVSQALRDQSGFFKGVSDAIGENVAKINGAFYKENTAIGMVVSNLVAMNTVLGKAKPDQIGAVGKSFGEDTTKDVRALQDATIGVTKETRIYGDVVAEAKTKTNAHERGIQDLKLAMHDGALTMKEYSDKMKELSEDYAFQFNLIHGILQPAKEWNLSVEILNDAVKHGTISLFQYNEQLAKLNAQPVDKDKLNSLREAFGRPEAQRIPSFVGPKTFGGIEFAVGVDNSVASAKEEVKGFGDEFALFQQKGGVADAFLQKTNENFAKLTEVMGDARTAAEKYNAEQKVINEGTANGLTDDQRVLALQNLKDKYTTIRTPAEQYALALRKINEEQQLGLGSAEAYDDALRDLRVQYGQGTFPDGLVNGLKTIRKEVTDVAGEVSTTLVDAFHSVNDALTDLITTGTTDWRKMAQGMEREIAGNLLKSIEGELANAITGAATKHVTTQVSAAATGVTTGTSAATTMLAAAPAIGAAIGAAAALGMAASGVLGGAAGAAASLTEAGGLFGFATGGSFVVGGDGGRDTTPVAFAATRGERVTIETAGQQRQTSAPAAGASYHIVNVYDQDAAAREALNTRKGEVLLTNYVNKNRRTVGHLTRK